jgi:hypothetical protein
MAFCLTTVYDLIDSNIGKLMQMLTAGKIGDLITLIDGTNEIDGLTELMM